MKLQINTLLTWFMQIFLIGLFFYLISIRDILAFLTLLAICLSFLPAILRKSYNVNIPWQLEFAIVFSIFLDIIGSAFRIYHVVTGYDFLTHALGTAVISILAFMIVYTLDFLGVVRMNLKMIGFFTFVFALAVGSLYEIAEFITDFFLDTNAIISLENTILDMIFNTFGGGVVAIFGMRYFKVLKKKEISKVVEPYQSLLKIFGIKKK